MIIGAFHRIELWDAQEQIVNDGYEKWMGDMINYYSCSNCSTINSAYDIKCRSCEHQPSNQYTKNHGKEVLEFLKKQQFRPKNE